MGENEQGGMLRTVVVIGLIAIIAILITLGVVGLKSSLRTNALMGATMGQNILKIDQSDYNKTFHPLGGYETLTYDASTDTYTLVLSTKSQFATSSGRGRQGIYYGQGGSNAPKDYDAFLAGDKYYMSADIRTTSDVSLMPKISHGMEFQSSNVEMSVNPDITDKWRHYETKGVRLDTWGEPLIWFNNGSGQPVTFEIKNVKLIREV